MNLDVNDETGFFVAAQAIFWVHFLEKVFSKGADKDHKLGFNSFKPTIASFHYISKDFLFMCTLESLPMYHLNKITFGAAFLQR